MSNVIEKPFVLDGEEVWPRTVNERYGIFRVKNGGRPDLVATCRTKAEIGATVIRVGAEGAFEDYTFGLMDGRDHKDKKGKWIGRWIVRPWVTGGPTRKEIRDG
jgi:hypothetical protein